jgi:hypothetical protein
MAVQSPYLLPGMNPAAVVQNPVANQIQDTGLAPLSVGRQGDSLTSGVHDAFYTGTARGNVFVANANDATGRTILAPGGTTSGFMFYNPVGSGINMEILEILVLPLTATDVVGVIGVEYGAPPTTVGNAATVRNTLINGNGLTALGKASYGSTIAAMTFLQWLPVFIQTTAGVLQGSSGLYIPRGTFVLAPGGAMNIVSSTTQSTNLWAQSVKWAEWRP